ncbi:MAG TPA: hypothetical protein VHA75_07575, partial [Rugosimonospora sp.]|nr:hypothetical protein [Rugosimonospora sp.]
CRCARSRFDRAWEWFRAGSAWMIGLRLHSERISATALPAGVHNRSGSAGTVAVQGRGASHDPVRRTAAVQLWPAERGAVAGAGEPPPPLLCVNRKQFQLSSSVLADAALVGEK